MVEGHSVHRVAARHRQYLLGRTFHATSPNGRFAVGAAVIHQKQYTRVEAIGKNLFCFFAQNTDNDTESTIVHVHFGMAGHWAIYNKKEETPAPRATTRLRLVSLDDEGLVADLSAMTVVHGTMTLYEKKRMALGQDPLRDDCDPEALWKRITSSSRSIGALIMDQSFFSGPGNIYRAEILFKAGIHPNTLGKQLDRSQFDTIWYHSVDLLRRGFETGSILTVDPEEATRFGLQHQRRYIYNQSHCPRCQTRIVVWEINSRTCYACPTCQPITTPVATAAAVIVTPEHPCEPFYSHCARESLEQRLLTPGCLTVAELRSELLQRGIGRDTTKGLKRAQLVDLLLSEISHTRRTIPDSTSSKKKEKISEQKTSAFVDLSHLKVSELSQALHCEFGVPSSELRGLNREELVGLYETKISMRRQQRQRFPMVSSEEAAREKALAGESLAVEHTAELAPVQARRVRTKIDVVQKVERKRRETSASSSKRKKRDKTKRSKA